MDDDIKRVWWITVAIAMVVLIGNSIVTPAANKIKQQETIITSSSYSSP